MVNTGHPSKACETCRARRVKCDETRPTCNRCTKAGRVCGGYRALEDIVLQNPRNGSKSKPKAKSRSLSDAGGRTKSNGSSSSEVIPFRGHSASVGRDTSAPQADDVDNSKIGPPARNGQGTNNLARALVQMHQPSRALSFEVDDVAVSFFVNNFVPLVNQKDIQDVMFQIPKLVCRSSTYSSLAHLVKAVSLHFFNHHERGNRALTIQPARHYGMALKALRLNWHDPRHRYSIETLASILLAAFYETLTPLTFPNIGWEQHIDALIDVLAARDAPRIRANEHQLLMDSAQDTALFRRLIQGRDLADMSDSLMETVDFEKDYLGSMTTLVKIKLAEIRSRAGKTVNMAMTPELRKEIANLAIDAKDLYSLLTYPDLEWTVYKRIGKLYVLNIILYCKERLLTGEELLRDSIYIDHTIWLNDLLENFCATIKYWMHGDLKALEERNIDVNVLPNLHSLSLSGCILYPAMFVMLQTTHVREHQKKYLVSELHFVAEHIGIGQAKDFADIVAKDRMSGSLGGMMDAVLQAHGSRTPIMEKVTIFTASNTTVDLEAKTPIQLISPNDPIELG